jgi:hypothetical protein
MPPDLYKLMRFLRAVDLPPRVAYFTCNGTWLPDAAADLASQSDVKDGRPTRARRPGFAARAAAPSDAQAAAVRRPRGLSAERHSCEGRSHDDGARAGNCARHSLLRPRRFPVAPARLVQGRRVWRHQAHPAASGRPVVQRGNRECPEAGGSASRCTPGSDEKPAS